MNRSDMDFIEAQTKRLEAIGIVLRNRNGEYFVCMPCEIRQQDQGPLHPHPKRGRKRKFASDYERLKAHRRSKSRMITK